jgi:hypothetical protein
VVFAAHQLIEAFVWWGLEGELPAAIGRGAAWLYLAIASESCPSWFPWRWGRRIPARIDVGPASS